jgi:hypothetical protein
MGIENPESRIQYPVSSIAIRSTKDYVRKNKLFLQNKANFKKVKLNVTKVLTKDYVQMDTWSIRKTKPIKANKSQLNPIKANSNPIRTQTNPILARHQCGGSGAKKCWITLNALIPSMISLSTSTDLSCSGNGLVARILMRHCDINLQ